MRSIKDYDELVWRRAGQQVCEADDGMVATICDKLRIWLETFDWHHFQINAKLDQVPGVMTRLQVFDGAAVEVRLHFFQDPTETMIHNHRQSFFSHCLKGGYKHQLWQVVEDANQEHWGTNRTQDPTLKEGLQKQPGELRVAYSHTYHEGGGYFIHQATLHTVKPVDGTTALTVYIKGKSPAGDTWYRSNSAALTEDRKVQDTPVEGDQKWDLLQEIWKTMQRPSTRPPRAPEPRNGRSGRWSRAVARR